MKKWLVGLVVFAGVASMLLLVVPRLLRPSQHWLEADEMLSATQLHKVQLIGAREGRGNITLNQVVSDNYASPVLVSGLIAPGAPSSVHWSDPGANSAPRLLDRSGSDANVAISDEPARFGSLVQLPLQSPAEPTDWAIVVLANDRVKRHVVIFSNQNGAALSDEELTRALADFNRQRAERKLAQIPDPRQLPDRLNK